MSGVCRHKTGLHYKNKMENRTEIIKVILLISLVYTLKLKRYYKVLALKYYSGAQTRLLATPLREWVCLCTCV